MKIPIFKVASLLLFAFSSFQLNAQSPRKTILFNTGWKFHKGDAAGADQSGYNDSNWRKLTLPHDWSIEGPFGQQWASSTAYLPAGIGWYRKSFDTPSGLAGKKLSIYFDGVNNNSEVWINNHFLGKRPYGFIPFEYDLTPYLNKSGHNTIAVKVNHSQFADSRWYTGSGIYRNVYLVSTNPVHLETWGVAFTTNSVTAKSAQAKISVSLKNESASAANVTVKAILHNAGNTVAASTQQNLQVNAGEHGERNLNFEVANPQLWSVGHPDLYQLEVALYVNGRLVDGLTQNVGIRSAVFDKDKGFFLNGKNMKLKGVCVHDDAGALGVAVPAVVWERRLSILKEAGVNSLRLSHNPHADYLYDLCDKMGILVMDEAFDEWERGKNKWIAGWNKGEPGQDGYHEYFAEWADRDLADMVKRDRNHASIILWSIGNEIDYPNDPYTHEVLNTGNNPQIYGKGYTPGHPPASQLTDIAKKLVAVVKQHDTSRPVTAALAGVVMSNEVGYPDVLDAVGYNYQEFRYTGDHAKWPNRIIYGSENGMDGKAWDAVVNNPSISAQYLWTGIDYLGEAHEWPSRSSGSGLLDLAGFKKPEFYYRQSLWSSQPMVYIGTSPIPKKLGKENHDAEPNWNWPAGQQVRISCFTNCDEAELFLNGKSLGKKSKAEAENHMLTWDVDYQPGELSVKGYNKGTVAATYQLVTNSEPVAIKILKDVYTDKGGLLQITAAVVDKNGHVVYGANNQITVNSQNTATLLGVESADHQSHEDYKADKHKVYHGKLIAYLQPKTASKLTVMFSAPGLKPAVYQK
jgi:beta-galactosidase/beta-glucuronidase